MQPGGGRPISGVLPLWGLFKQTVPRPKNSGGILPKLQFPGGAGLRARHLKAAREGRPTERQAFFNRLTFLHILARNLIIYWYTWFRHPDHGAKPEDPG
jgi:hypothetical protein